MNPYRSVTFRLPRRAWPDWALDLLSLALIVCFFGMLWAGLVALGSTDWRFIPAAVGFGVLLYGGVILDRRMRP